ncbi:MAG TPA: hypothetical protein VK524_24585 [Polyangiaceae bacterium]|nr:hypothetical protein [Polyangiaceae bacterium]
MKKIVQVTEALEPIRRRRRELAVLVTPVGLYIVCMTVGVALAPMLLERAPVLLFLMAPLGRHLVLISPALETVTFTAVGVLGYFLVDPFIFLIGRRYGDSAIVWIEKRSGMMGRGARWVERLFKRAARVVLFLSPGPLVNLLAGAGGMKAPLWLSLNLAGTLTSVLVTRAFGELLERPIEAIRQFVENNVGWLTALSVAIVLISVVLRRRRMRRVAGESASAEPPAVL